MGQPVNAYDAYSRLVAQNAYDPRNLLEENTDGMGRVTDWNYDQDGLAASTEDGLEHVTYFSTDVLGRLDQAADPLSHITKQGFDADGNRISLTNALNKTLQFGYDAGGRLISTMTAANLTTTYAYNSNNTVATITSPLRQVTTNTYDKVLRLVQSADGFAATLFGYDKNSRLTTASDNAYGRKRQVYKVYDEVGQLTSYTDENGNVLRYAYDPAGNLVQITYPDGKNVNYSYDADNHLSSVTDWAGRKTSYAYDKNGRLVATIGPDGSQESRAYDTSGVLASIEDTGKSLIYSAAITTDAAGRTTNEIPSPSATYGLPYAPRPLTATYDADNRLVTFNGMPVKYDGNGNMLSGSTSGFCAGAFRYDARNQLSEGAGVSHAYGVLGDRIGMRMPENTSAQFVVDPSGALSRVLVKTATRLTGSVPTYYVYGLGLVGEETGGVYRAYHFDSRGSTVALTNIKGVVTDTFLYGPYGESVKHDGNSTTPFQFNGKFGVQTDSNGLLYMRARYYNPAIKRFMNQDIRFGNIDPGISLNRFAFANGNPVDGVDPFDLATITINVQSFISAPSISAPPFAPVISPSNTFSFNSGAQFTGDNRGFLASPATGSDGETYRTSQTLVLDPANLWAGVLMTANTGLTQYILPNGITNTGQAPTNGFSHYVDIYSYPGYVDVTMHAQHEGDPLVFGAWLVAPIDYTLDVLIDPSNNNVDVAFDHTQFPSFQVFLDGVPVINYQEQGDAGNLFHTTEDTFSTTNGTAPHIIPSTPVAL